MLEFIKGAQEQLEYTVPLNWIVDIGINPRKIDEEYAKTIPEETNPIVLGVVTGEKTSEYRGKKVSLENVLFLVDGNHRTFSKRNIYKTDKINAKVKIFDTLADAVIEAYKCNTSHGRILNDRDICKGVHETATILKQKYREGRLKKIPTGIDIAEKLNITPRQVRTFISWRMVEKILGEEISKTKADVLSPFVKDKSKLTEEQRIVKEEKLKLFWKYNKDLTYDDLKEAKKIFTATGEVVNYVNYKISKMMDLSLDLNETNSLNEGKVELSGKEKVKTLDKEPIELSTGEEPNSFITGDGIKVGEVPAGNCVINNSFEEPAKKISVETMAYNVLLTIQENFLDNVSIFKEIVDVNSSEESKDRFSKRASDYKGVISNLQSKLEELLKVVEPLI